MNTTAFTGLPKSKIAADGAAGHDHVAVDCGDASAEGVNEDARTAGDVVADRSLVNRQRTGFGLDAVSYTHLTLPTIYSV